MNTEATVKPFRLAVKAVIFDDQQRCLLLRRSAINHHFVGCWEWPGGKVDEGEDFRHSPGPGGAGGNLPGSGDHGTGRRDRI